MTPVASTRNDLLEGYTVIDFTRVLAGPYCTRLLADLGARVIKIERPGEGDPTRMQLRDLPGVDSLYFTMLNSNKRGITLNVQSTRGGELLKQLAARADFLIETFPPGTLDRRQFDSRLVVVSITPFGQTGPYSNYKGSDLVVMAMSGLMSLIGDPGKTPLRVTLPQSPMWAGMYAARRQSKFWTLQAK